MNIKNAVLHQYRQIVSVSTKQTVSDLIIPPEGWIKTIRTALNMSGRQLATRLNVTKARISRVEKDEINGSVTLKTMQSTAEAMGCRFVYAIIPNHSIEDVIRQQALKQAKLKVNAAAVHMALEEQLISNEHMQSEIKRVANEFIEKQPKDFWDEPILLKD